MTAEAVEIRRQGRPGPPARPHPDPHRHAVRRAEGNQPAAARARAERAVGAKRQGLHPKPRRLRYPPMANAFLAVDWGTTNCRAWRIGPDGQVEARRASSRWASPGCSPARPRRGSRARCGRRSDALDLPALLCGMIGSNLGWTAVPYLEAPADLKALAGALHPSRPRARRWPSSPASAALRLDGTPT